MDRSLPASALRVIPANASPCSLDGEREKRDPPGPFMEINAVCEFIAGDYVQSS